MPHCWPNLPRQPKCAAHSVHASSWDLRGFNSRVAIIKDCNYPQAIKKFERSQVPSVKTFLASTPFHSLLSLMVSNCAEKKSRMPLCLNAMLNFLVPLVPLKVLHTHRPAAHARAGSRRVHTTTIGHVLGTFNLMCTSASP